MKWPFLRSGDDEAAEAAAVEEQRERVHRTGEVLRQARVTHGKTLYDVERDTRINRLYLEALEAGRFEVLPAPVYARGFMRAYARYLGLDPEEAVLAVPRDLPRPLGLEPLPGLRRSMPASLPSFSPSAVIAAAVVLVVVVAGAFAAPRFFGGDSGEPPAVIATPTPDAVAETQPLPDLVGSTRDEASAALADAGLTPLVFESLNPAPEGQVFRQTPAAGETVRRGDVITIFVSLGPGDAVPAPDAPSTPAPN